MRRVFAVLALLALVLPLVLSGMPQGPAALAQDGAGKKVSSLLSHQVEAKRRVLEARPQQEGQVDILQAMRGMGMEIGNLNRQKIFIHLTQPPSQSQITELESLGLTLYLDSWIPPVKHHPYGFLIADMPVGALEAVAGKGYIIRLETAERQLEPQNDLAATATNADDVWTAGYDGTGVTIAVLDSGFQIGSGTGHAAKHGDFPNMTAGTDYKDYSNYPTTDNDVANTYTGHGTHVAASALEI